MTETQMNLMEQLFRVVSLLHRYQHHLRRDHARAGDPHRGQGRVLSLLKMKPEITQRELSYLLDMRNQSLGELLGKLERNGFITRTPSEADRRVLNVTLTEAGSDAADELEKEQEDQNKLFDCLSEEEQANLGEYLSRLLHELESRMGDGGGAERGHGEHGRHGGHGGHGGNGEHGVHDRHGPHGRHRGHGAGPRGGGRDGFHFRIGRSFGSMEGGWGRPLHGWADDRRPRPHQVPESESDS